MRYRFLLFDLDGTLIDPLDDLTAAANAARHTLGLEPLTSETVRGFVGDGLIKFLQRSIPAESIERARPIFQEYYGAHLTDHTRLYPGVLDVLSGLHTRGCRMAVVSNKPVLFTQRIVDRLGLAPLLSVVLGGDSLPQRKPEPEPFLRALESLGGRPSEALVVGDGHQDIEAARAAQMPCCGVLYGMGDPQTVRDLKPDYLLGEIAELPGIVGP